MSHVEVDGVLDRMRLPSWPPHKKTYCDLLAILQKRFLHHLIPEPGGWLWVVMADMDNLCATQDMPEDGMRTPERLIPGVVTPPRLIPKVNERVLPVIDPPIVVESTSDSDDSDSQQGYWLEVIRAGAEDPVVPYEESCLSPLKFSPFQTRGLPDLRASSLQITVDDSVGSTVDDSVDSPALDSRGQASGSTDPDPNAHTQVLSDPILGPVDRDGLPLDFDMWDDSNGNSCDPDNETVQPLQPESLSYDCDDSLPQHVSLNYDWDDSLPRELDDSDPLEACKQEGSSKRPLEEIPETPMEPMKKLTKAQGNFWGSMVFQQGTRPAQP